ncbi:MAG: hypothetical protein ACREFR_00320 [Limisphaerales bacterium]
MKNWLFALFTLVIGIALGAGVLWVHLGRFFGRQIIGFSYTKVVDDVTTLTMLRNKSYADLIQNKGNDLSDTLLGLAEVEHLNSLSTNQIRYLKMAANYEKKYALQTGDTNVDQEVDNFLQKIREMK